MTTNKALTPEEIRGKMEKKKLTLDNDPLVKLSLRIIDKDVIDITFTGNDCVRTSGYFSVSEVESLISDMQSELIRLGHRPLPFETEERK